jgi:predicted DNA-binding transcriptional regulator AlpA
MTKSPEFRLPPSLAPRGLNRVQAAAYVGVGTSLFDRMIQRGWMPKPKRVDGRVIWDRHALDEAFACLPEEEGAEPKADNPWDLVSNVG